MKINVDKINQVITILIIVIVLAAGLSCFFLNKVQLTIVGIGGFFAVLNLLGIRFFLDKNKESFK